MLQFPPFSLKTLLHSALWSAWARAASKACAGSAVLPRVNTSLLCLWLVPLTAISPCHCQGPQTHRITSFIKNTGILKMLFYWGIVGLQCCVNFCCKVIQLYMCVCIYIYIPSFSYSFLLWFIKGYWIAFAMLYYRALLFSHLICLHLLTLTLVLPSPPPRSVETTSLFSVSLVEE